MKPKTESIEGENSNAVVWTLKEDTHWPTPSQEEAPPTASACTLFHSPPSTSQENSPSQTRFKMLFTALSRHG